MVYPAVRKRLTRIQAGEEKAVEKKGYNGLISNLYQLNASVDNKQ